MIQGKRKFSKMFTSQNLKTPGVFKFFRRDFLYNRKSGFAVLFSIMLASFLITLGISIFSISLKETMITTSVRDSQIAYYAADSARECALYWDVKKGAFPACISDDCSETTEADEETDIICNGFTTTVKLNRESGTLAYSTGGTPIQDFFKMSADESSPRSHIKITKTWIPNQGVQTVIDTFGQNTGIVGRRVERGIRQINN